MIAWRPSFSVTNDSWYHCELLGQSPELGILRSCVSDLCRSSVRFNPLHKYSMVAYSLVRKSYVGLGLKSSLAAIFAVGLHPVPPINQGKVSLFKVDSQLSHDNQP